MFEIRMLLAFLVYSLIVSLVIGQQFRDASFYCGLSDEHTMCIHAGLGGDCLPEFLREPSNRNVSANEAMEIVDLHNRLRNLVASNQTTQFPAANMRVMRWDSELASIAQRLADQCKFEHDCPVCRSVGPSREGTVGQNIGMTWNRLPGGSNDWNVTINSWFNEISSFPINDSSAIASFQFNPSTGHYTQLVWATSDRLGCGVITFLKEDVENKLYVCNYGEAGNSRNEPIYTIGEGCSACPGGRCSSLYNSLCEAPRFARSGNSALNLDYLDSYDVPVPNYSNVPLHHGSYPRHGNRYNVPVPSYSNVPLHHGSYPRYGYSFPRYY